MSKRQSAHSDNELIDELTEDTTPSQQGSAGGQVRRNVGTRSEAKRAMDPANREPVTGSDQSAGQRQEGPKIRLPHGRRRQNLLMCA
jgi:hypothetical protein